MVGKVLAKIFKWDPSKDTAPRYETYEIPWMEGLTVLELLRYVYENFEPIAFSYGCRSMHCGRCGVMVNGQPVLACSTFLQPGEIRIDPLKGFPVIRDLVVDRSKAEIRMLEIRPQLERVDKPSKIPESLPYEAVMKCMELFNCRTCYLCHSACPVVDAAWSSFSGPTIRTRIAIRVYDPRDDADRLREAISEGLWLCATCMKCEEVCPRGIDISELTVKELRTMAVSKGLPLPQGYARLAQNIKEGGRTVKPRGTPLLEMVPRVVEPVGKKVDGKVGLFTGCIYDYMLQGAGLAAIRVLARCGVEVVIPKGQVCCGMPMFWTGQRDVAVGLVERNVRVFEEAGVDRVLTICAACGATWKRDIPRVAKEVGRSVEFEVQDIHDFLMNDASLPREGMRPLETKVTYHDPCHLRRGMKIYREPRSIISDLLGLDFIEMEEADRCCGGVLRYGDTKVADRIGRAKIASAKETGAEIIVTACPLCTNQIQIVAEKMGLSDLKVLSVIELIENSYKDKIEIL